MITDAIQKAIDEQGDTFRLVKEYLDEQNETLRAVQERLAELLNPPNLSNESTIRLALPKYREYPEPVCVREDPHDAHDVYNYSINLLDKDDYWKVTSSARCEGVKPEPSVGMYL